MVESQEQLEPKEKKKRIRTLVRKYKKPIAVAISSAMVTVGLAMIYQCFKYMATTEK